MGQTIQRCTDTSNRQLLIISDKDKLMIQTTVQQAAKQAFVEHLHEMMHFMHFQILLVILEAAKQHPFMYLLSFYVCVVTTVFYYFSGPHAFTLQATTEC